MNRYIFFYLKNNYRKQYSQSSGVNEKEMHTDLFIKKQAAPPAPNQFLYDANCVGR
jgi:hypothetical protein